MIITTLMFAHVLKHNYALTSYLIVYFLQIIDF